MEKLATTSLPIHELIAKRWSPRSFDKSKYITKEQITQLIEAARWAPSSMNEQPWRFIVWDRNNDPENFQKAFDTLAEGNQIWCKNVNTLILALAYQKFSDGNPNPSAQFDTGLAVENLILQSISMGLISHPMSGFDKAKIKQIFEIPEDYTPMAMIAVGYQADPDLLESPELVKREKASRIRKKVSDIAYWGNFKDKFEI